MRAQAAQLDSSRGICSAVGAYLCWGLFPLFWRQLASVDALELIAHRHVWSLAAVVLLLSILGGFRELADACRRPVLLGVSFVAAVFLTINWLVFVWGVAHGRVIECSLGYFLQPLAAVLVGRFALRERLSRMQMIALAVAAAGVAFLIWRTGSVPWISLGIVASWAPYSLLKKRAALPALPGFALETLLLAPLALGYLGWLAWHGRGALGHAPAGIEALVVASGLVTAVPLLLFADGARRLRLTTLGLLQYIVPTMQFLVGWAVFHEPLARDRLVAFVFIWIGLAIYGVDMVRAARGPKRPDSNAV
jgi:chloramphenicol-sensitive protein RarD